MVWLVFIESQRKVKLSLGLIRIITECLNWQKLLLGSRTLHKIVTNSSHKKIRNTRLTRSQLFLEANKMRALEFFTNDLRNLVKLSDSYRETKLKTNGATDKFSSTFVTLSDDYFSSNIFGVGNREWSNLLSFSSREVKLHMYIYLSIAFAIFAESH